MVIHDSRLCNIPSTDLFLLWGCFHFSVSVSTLFLIFVGSPGRAHTFPLEFPHVPESLLFEFLCGFFIYL